MAKFVKLILVLVSAVAGILVIGAVALVLFFDPNDYRDDIAIAVTEATGREFAINGDVSLSLFPWLAIEIGQTTLGNAEGFGDEPFVRFDNARLSVKLLPLLTGGNVKVGTATLEGFTANLAVLRDGRNNWEDLASQGEATDSGRDEPRPASGDGSAGGSLDIDNVQLLAANVSYRDDQAGSRYELSDVNLTTGRIAFGERFEIDGSLAFSATPDELEGDMTIVAGVLIGERLQEIVVDNLQVTSTINGVFSQPAEIRFDSRAIEVDTAAEQLTLGELDLQALGLTISADVQPINYSGTPTVSAALRVADFSLTDLMGRIDIEPPVTADPNALQTLSFEANAAMTDETLALSSLVLRMDDTALTGDLSLPLTEDGFLEFDLRADSITLDNYMAPPAEAPTASEESADVEIPVELIRALKARGSLRLDEAFVGPVTFTSMELGVASDAGKLRLYPIGAEFFGGSYAGDVNVDASGEVPRLAVNEFINDVDIAAMLESMYGVTDVSGTVNANFVLAGSGLAMSDIASDLGGSMTFELADGAWQGVDVWQQLRSARALYKREEPPPPRLPARTEFTAITASGPVTNGVFNNDNLVAELPFLRVTGTGTVDLGANEVDYSVQARILETPEFMSNASEDELNDFTEALIPIRIRGPLASPSFRPDIEGLFRQEVERALEDTREELEAELLNQLLGGDSDAEGSEEGQEEEKDLEDQLKDQLRNIFPR